MTDRRAPQSARLRFRRLLAANVAGAAFVWVLFYVVVTLITVAVGVSGNLTGSVWENATQVPRWYVLFVGVGLINQFLPVYIANGQTRRQFGVDAAITVCLFVPCVAGLLALGYLLEALLLHLTGWPQGFGRQHLFASPLEVHLVLLELTALMVAWMVAGTFISAGFYRWRGGGLLTIPVGVALVVLAEYAIAGDADVPFVQQLPSLGVPSSVPLTVVVAIGCLAVGLALTWAVIRDVPLRNKSA